MEVGRPFVVGNTSIPVMRIGIHSYLLVLDGITGECIHGIVAVGGENNVFILARGVLGTEMDYVN